MTPEELEKRIQKKESNYKLAEQMWDVSDNEGDENEKMYWIHGFVTALNIMEK